MTSKKRKKERKIETIVLCVLAGIEILLGVIIKSWKIVLEGVLLPAVFVLVGFVIIPALLKAIIRNKYKKEDQRLTGGFRKYKVDESGIDTTSFAGTSHNVWSAMKSFGNYDKYIWIKRVDNQYFLFDTTLLSRENLAKLRSLLSAHIPDSM